MALVLAILLAVVPAVHAADRVVTIYPPGLLQNALAGEYEWATGYDSTYAVTVSATRVASAEVEATSIAGGFSLRKYLNSQALDGFYLGGGVNVASANSVDKTTSESSNVFLLGIGGRCRVQAARSRRLHRRPRNQRDDAPLCERIERR